MTELPGGAAHGVAAIVVSFNRRAVLADRLASLSAQIPPVEQIVVVDNASRDGTIGMLRAEFPDVTLLALSENLGAAGGFATGIEHALACGADRLWLFNDNDRAEPGALAALLASGGPVADKVIAGCATTVGEGVRRVGFRWDHGLRPPLAAPPEQTEYEVDVSTFNGLLVPADAFRRVGVPRADFFMMWEEYEWCLRARDDGWRIVLLETPLVDARDDGPPTHVYPPWRGYYQARNALITVLDRRNRRALCWYAMRELRYLLAIVRRDRRARRYALRLRGIVDGLRRRTGRVVEPTA